MSDHYDQDQPPDTRTEIPFPIRGGRQVRDSREILHHGEAFGWLGFWLALGMVLSTIIIAAQWSHATVDRTSVSCADLNLSHGVCDHP